jgi:hypothetical protein
MKNQTYFKQQSRVVLEEKGIVETWKFIYYFISQLNTVWSYLYKSVKLFLTDLTKLNYLKIDLEISRRKPITS